MSDWHDEFTEPMHDTPADKDPLIAAMEAAGYTYDGLESTNDNLRFFGEGGQVITMGGWHECEEWLNGVVFDDPQACKCADEEAKQSVLAKLKEQQLHEPPHRPERPFIFCGPEERVRE